jgi:hypothetical protein
MILTLAAISVFLLSMQIPSVNQTSILQILLQSMDKMPKSSLPSETNGTVQQTFGTIPKPSVYNANGIVSPNNPNTLIAKV